MQYLSGQLDLFIHLDNTYKYAKREKLIRFSLNDKNFPLKHVAISHQLKAGGGRGWKIMKCLPYMCVHVMTFLHKPLYLNQL